MDRKDNAIKLLKALEETAAGLTGTIRQLRSELIELNFLRGSEKHSVHNDTVSYIAVKNGSRSVVKTYDEKDFDLIVNCISGTVRLKNTAGKLIECDLYHIGSARLRLLTFMMEHPDYVITTDLAARIYPDSNDTLEKGALRKTISILRKMLGDCHNRRRYITTVPYLLSYGSNQRGYKLNKKRNYLLIKKI